MMGLAPCSITGGAKAGSRFLAPLPWMCSCFGDAPQAPFKARISHCCWTFSPLPSQPASEGPKPSPRRIFIAVRPSLTTQLQQKDAMSLAFPLPHFCRAHQAASSMSSSLGSRPKIHLAQKTKQTNKQAKKKRKQPKEGVREERKLLVWQTAQTHYKTAVSPTTPCLGIYRRCRSTIKGRACTVLCMLGIQNAF